LGWAWNPNLSKRFPLIWEHAYATLSSNDRITTGDSGPGYVILTHMDIYIHIDIYISLFASFGVYEGGEFLLVSEPGSRE
jgi:hypothetical protein